MMDADAKALKDALHAACYPNVRYVTEEHLEHLRDEPGFIPMYQYGAGMPLQHPYEVGRRGREIYVMKPEGE